VGKMRILFVIQKTWVLIIIPARVADAAQPNEKRLHSKDSKSGKILDFR